MALASLLIHHRALVADGWALAVVPLFRAHKLDGAVAVILVIMVNECYRPLAVGWKKQTPSDFA
jgi:hypothetical protein